MGVYIPNMSKPKECGDCNFVQAFWDDKRWLFRCLVTDKIAEDCPLIEIPTPHGDIKDINTFLKDKCLTEYIEGDVFNKKYTYTIGTIAIYNAPTILEAEE